MAANLGSRTPAKDRMQQPLNRGPSVDQPAVDNPRYIRRGAPQPSRAVMCVTILEQDPKLMRWERVLSPQGASRDAWVEAGAMARNKSRGWWETVGVCHKGTRHNMKDVSDWRRDFPGEGNVFVFVTGERRERVRLAVAGVGLGSSMSPPDYIGFEGRRFERTPDRDGPWYMPVCPMREGDPLAVRA